MILIVSNKDDIHCDFVIQKLNARQIQFARINTEDFPTEITISAEFGNKRKSIIAKLAIGEIDLNCVTSIWYRRPLPPMIDGAISKLEFREHALREATSFLEGIWFNTNCLWVNHPYANHKAGEKLYQLDVAQKLGFEIPPSLITNSPQKAKEFIQKFGKVIIKPLKRSMLTVDGAEMAFYTSIVNKSDLENIESVVYAPHFFQRYMEKVEELRITIIGDRIFTVSIDSQATKGGKIDWRKAKMNELPYKVVELPENIATKCRALLEKLDLKFGAIDMIVTPNGEYVFLEINPNGQWIWLEQATGLPMINAMIDLLEHKK